MAAALGANEVLRERIPCATRADVQTAFGLAAINRNREGVEILLDAGADVNAFLPVHGHSTALHQAAMNDDAELVNLLLQRGARVDTRDTLWDATALDWAIHEKKGAARAALRKASR